MHKTTRLPWIATSLCLGLLLAGCGPQQQKNAAKLKTALMTWFSVSDEMKIPTAA